MEYQWNCEIESDMKIETKIRDKSLEESGINYSKSEI